MCITNSVKEIRLSTQPYVNSIQRVPGNPTLALQARDNFDNTNVCDLQPTDGKDLPKVSASFSRKENAGCR